MIELLRNEIEVQLSTDNAQHVWPLVVTAVSDTAGDVGGIPNEIFVMHAMPEAFGTEDEFDNVASVQDIANIGLYADTDGGPSIIPYYRVDSIIKYCYSEAEALKLWDDIVEDVKDLIDNWEASAEVTPSITVVIS